MRAAWSRRCLARLSACPGLLTSAFQVRVMPLATPTACALLYLRLIWSVMLASAAMALAWEEIPILPVL